MSITVVPPIIVMQRREPDALKFPDSWRRWVSFSPQPRGPPYRYAQLSRPALISGPALRVGFSCSAHKSHNLRSSLSRQIYSCWLSNEFQAFYLTFLWYFVAQRTPLCASLHSLSCQVWSSLLSNGFPASGACRRAAGWEFSKRGWKINRAQRGYGRGFVAAVKYFTTGDKKKGVVVRFEGFGSRYGGGLECNAAFEQSEAVTSGETITGGLTFSSASTSMEGKPIWRKITQSVNVSGIYFSARVILKDRHLAIPHVSVPDISWIDWKALKTRGFEGVLFDKDNTLTVPYGQSVWPPLNDSLHECRTVFGGQIALFSNSAGLLQFDPDGSEAKVLEERLSIPVVRHGQKKPAGNALALSKYFGCEPSKLIMVGDRYFTDVVYGNNNGLLTVRSAPLSTQGEPFVVRQVRILEETLIDHWTQQGVLPTTHMLFDNPVDFIKGPGC